jgi:hypothetical protein
VASVQLKDRKEARTKALIRARMRSSGPERDVCILDVSASGVLATTAAPPRRGDFIELIAGMHSLVGHVEWAGDRRFGLSLRERIDVTKLLSGDSGEITLKRQARDDASANRMPLAVLGDARSLSQTGQYVFLAAAAVAAALMVAHYVGEELGSLDQAGAAMQAARTAR